MLAVARGRAGWQARRAAQAGPAAEANFSSTPQSPTHLHPGLVVEVGDVELAAGGVGQHLVVLLEDFVEPHVVEVDVPARGTVGPVQWAGVSAVGPIGRGRQQRRERVWVVGNRGGKLGSCADEAGGRLGAVQWSPCNAAEAAPCKWVWMGGWVGGEERR